MKFVEFLDRMKDMPDQGPIIVAVSGFSSNVGKTTLVCELLRSLPGWEAIKLTRGHYRSCGKDPHACCVSNLLRDEPVVRSGREENYEAGKDTGRFWDSGAANVHWVIATDDQVEAGIREAIGRVKSKGVVVEGNSFLQYITPDVSVMCARSEGGNPKSSARAALQKTDYLYLSSLNGDADTAHSQFAEWLRQVRIDLEIDHIPILTRQDISALAANILDLSETRATNCELSGSASSLRV
jgi:molybdopterin-guanine dinucleotide biosynthesis protein